MLADKLYCMIYWGRKRKGMNGEGILCRNGTQCCEKGKHLLYFHRHTQVAVFQICEDINVWISLGSDLDETIYSVSFIAFTEST